MKFSELFGRQSARLEQCVRNVVVRGRYEPVRIQPSKPAVALAPDIEAGRLTAEELLRRYCSIVHAQTRNIEATARRLDLDRRTIKAKLQIPPGADCLALSDRGA